MIIHEVSCDFFGCDPMLLDDPNYLQSVLTALAAGAGTRVVSASTHKYQPQGASVVVFVEESHLLLSTWPEHGIAVFNCLFSHGPNPEDLIAGLARSLGAKRFSTIPHSRTWDVDTPFPFPHAP